MFSSGIKFPTFSRAYTLHLDGVDKNDSTWSEGLWATHEAINKGAKVFCDWFLTLRGGLPASLASTDPNASREVLRVRRILLALSWLTVENGEGSHGLAYQLPNEHDRFQALTEILESYQVPQDEIEEWISDCEPSLSAKTRDDACWVNRHRLFRELPLHIAPDDIDDLLFNRNPQARFFDKEAYFTLPKPSQNEENEAAETVPEEKPKKLAQKARGWLCDHYGEGKKADYASFTEIYSTIHDVLEAVEPPVESATLISLMVNHLDVFSLESPDMKGIQKKLSGRGYKSKSKNQLDRLQTRHMVDDETFTQLKKALQEDRATSQSKIGSKGKKEYADYIEQAVRTACGIPYQPVQGKANRDFYTVMLDHAARRISQTHSWIKLNEQERFKSKLDMKAMTTVPLEAQRWLDKYCEDKSRTLGALEPYSIRNQAVSAWEHVLDEWSKPNIVTEEDRKEAGRELQNHPDIDKFGDINLFMDLAAEAARCVWQENGKISATILKLYVKAKTAEIRMRHYKVPAFCHPDPLLHPIFCDFGTSRPKIEFAVLSASKFEEMDCRRLNLELYTGQDVKTMPLKWRSKRFFNEIVKGKPTEEENTSISRLHRFAKSASGQSDSQKFMVTHVFEQKVWSGRLQAPRQKLAELHRILKKDPERFHKLRQHIPWFITCSTDLEAQGPWYDYVFNLPDQTPFKRSGKSGDPVSYSGWPHEQLNKKQKREGRSKLMLCRLPGLRILSVDLGHRYGAACTVWETLSGTDVQALCQRTGTAPPGAQDLCFMAPFQGKNTLFRRIAGDVFEDRMPHPAPWARMDREFLIRLQGETDNPRKALPDEVKALEQSLLALNYTEALFTVGSPVEQKRIDGVMRNFLSVVKQAQKRHGTLARLACNMAKNEQIQPGNQREELASDEAIQNHLTDTLVKWAALLLTSQWNDKDLKALWDHHVGKPLEGLPERPALEGGYSAKRLKEWREQLRVALQPLAQALHHHPAKRQSLAQALAVHWGKEEMPIQAALKQAKAVLLPRGQRGKAKTNRHMGGLSLNRIANIKVLYQQQKAYFTRLNPQTCESKTASTQFAQKTLTVLEELRKNRVKQLSSRIMEAALGLGTADKRVDRKWPKHSHTVPYNLRFKPCHAIVIEDLKHYRPDALQTRRENRGLIDWSAGKIRQRLQEDCDLYGLQLREVQPSFTSRQDSRTGTPGIRCKGVPTERFLNGSATPQEDPKSGLGRYKQALQTCFQKGFKLPRTVLIPRKGGEIFMTMNPDSPIANGIQADLNAAANIGLKALLDPDWEGSWWMIPLDAATGTPFHKHLGSPVLAGFAVPPENEQTVSQKPKKERSSRPANYVFRDTVTFPLRNTFVRWQRTTPFWKDVEEKVIERLKQRYGITEPIEKPPLSV